MPPQPDPAPVLDLIQAFRRSKTMFVAVSLGIFDRLAGNSKAAVDIRREDENLDSLIRLLDACVALGLLEREDEVYSNAAVAEAYLRRDSPTTMTGYIQYSDNVLYQLWGNLGDAVREGTHRWKQTFGADGPIFSQLYRTEESMREFLLGMHGQGMLSAPLVAAAFDLSRFRRIVDLGGATGHLAMAVAVRYPEMQAAVFDLPHVVEHSRPFVEGTRVELIGGDFFSDPLPPADLYALGRIVHDWAEDKIQALLARINAALPSGGALLIAESLLDDDLKGPVATHMQSLSMLLCTEGRERSFPQYAELLEQAGFGKVEGKLTGSVVDAVLAVKL
ncbi:MAG: class I SAM-dependent methyltransferase [Bryobacteraceae bacterium]